MTAQTAVAGAELIVIPTDTVYGIGADPFSPAAVSRLLAAKGRHGSSPPPVLAATTEAALAMADRGRMTEQSWEAALRLAYAFWPGPLTLVLPTLGWRMDTVAVRVPGHELARRVLRQTGPLAVTSANVTGQEPALTVEQAQACFGNRVAHYVDGGPATIGVASTIADLTGWPVRILRKGALDWGAITQVLEGTE